MTDPIAAAKTLLEMEPVNFATHGARELALICARRVLAEPSRDAADAMTDHIAAPDVEKAAGEAALECLTTGKPFAECLRKRGYIAVSEPSLDVVEAARRAVGRAYYGDPDYDFMDDSGPMQRNDVVVREIDAAIAAAEARVREECAQIARQFVGCGHIAAAIRAGGGR